VIATLDTGGGRRMKQISLTVGILLVGGLHISCGNDGDENPAAPGSQEAEQVIAATSSGIFLSADNGVSWTPTAIDDTTGAVFVTAVGEILAATINGAFFRSSDQGVSWSASGACCRSRAPFCSARTAVCSSPKTAETAGRQPGFAMASTPSVSTTAGVFSWERSTTASSGQRTAERPSFRSLRQRQWSSPLPSTRAATFLRAAAVSGDQWMKRRPGRRCWAVHLTLTFSPCSSTQRIISWRACCPTVMAPAGSFVRLTMGRHGYSLVSRERLYTVSRARSFEMRRRLSGRCPTVDLSRMS